MKKFLLSLAVLFAGVASAQTYYQAGDEVTDEIWEGESFLLSPDKSGARFLTNDGKNYLTDQIPTDDALVEFEEVGETEDGYVLWAIKFSNSELYIADMEMWDGMDSSDMVQDGVEPWDPAPYVFLTDDVKNAAKWTVLPAATRYKAEKGAEEYIANWRTWSGQGTGTDTEESKGNLKVHDGAFVIMRDKVSTSNPNTLSEGGLNPVYLEVQSDYTFFASWGANAWFISYPEEMDADMLLEAWVSSNLGDFDVESVKSQGVGTLAGMYTEASFAPLYAAWEAYLTYDGGYGEGDPSEILAALQDAWTGLERIQVEEGYYYVVAVRGSHAAWDNGGNIVTTGGYSVPKNAETGEYEVTFESSKYIWYFNPIADKEATFIIQNYGTGKYATSSSEGATIQHALQTKEEGHEFIFEFLPNLYGTIYIYHKNAAGNEDCAWNSYHGYAGTPVGNWRDRNDQGNHWQLLRVDTEKVLAMQEGLAQYNLNQELAALYDEAYNKYNNLRAAKHGVEGTGDFADHGFVALSDDATTINLTTNAPESAEGNILFLGDNDKNTYFHSDWHGAYPKPHSLILDLGEAMSLEGITVKIMKRQGTGEYNQNRAVTEWQVYGTNDDPNAEGATPAWTAQGKVTLKYTYDYAVEGDTVKNAVGLGSMLLPGDGYRYLRFEAVNNLNGEGKQFFAFSEFGVWTATEDLEAVTLLSEVPAAVKETLLAELAKAKVEVATGLATQAQIDALNAAYEEFLNNLPEPTRLTDAIAAAKEVSANIPTGADASYYPEAAKGAYDAVIAEVESTVADVMSLELINEGVDKLAAAKEALLKSLNMPAEGYYQIRIDAANYAEALLYASTDAVDTEEKNGLMARFSKGDGSVAEGDYTDDDRFAGSVASVWYLEKGQDNTVAIRSVSTGLYLQNNLSQGTKVQLTPEKVYFPLQADGLKNGMSYNFIVGTDSVSGSTLYGNINSGAGSKSGELVSWGSAAGADNSTFRFDEVALEEYAYGKQNFVIGQNATKFMTFLYDCVYKFADNPNSKIYEVAGFVAGEETNYIYFKALPYGATLEAGQGYLVKTLNDNDMITVTFNDKVVTEDMFQFSYEGKSNNGLTGTIFTTEVGAKYGVIGSTGIAYTTNKIGEDGEEIPATVTALSAYIDGNTLPVLDAAPEGDDYISIICKFGIESLNAIEGVEVVETAKTGVYTISGVRLNSTKNLPAGIYIINGKKVIK